MAIYKPSLLDKFKDFVNGLKANWEDYVDHVNNTTDAHGIDVIAEDLADHVAETAEDDVHGLAGKVIEESGEDGAKRYTRFANGLQICEGEFTLPNINAAWGNLYFVTLADRPTVTFIKPFKAGTVPFVSYSPTSIGVILSPTPMDITATQFTGNAIRGSALNTSVTLKYVAIGKWK